jgi:hypothetical protein
MPIIGRSAPFIIKRKGRKVKPIRVAVDHRSTTAAEIRRSAIGGSGNLPLLGRGSRPGAAIATAAHSRQYDHRCRRAQSIRVSSRRSPPERHLAEIAGEIVPGERWRPRPGKRPRHQMRADRVLHLGRAADDERADQHRKSDAGPAIGRAR